MMQAQYNSNSNPGLADFSAALMRAKHTPAKAVDEFERDSNAQQSASQAYDSTANRNISSLISQIQDDGPAGSSTASAAAAKPHAVKSRPVKPAESFSTDNNDMLSDDVVEISSLQNQVTTKNHKLHELEMELAQSTQHASSTTWLHFAVMMLITVIALMGFIVYKLVGETSELRSVVENQQGQVAAVYQPATPDNETSVRLQQLLGTVQTLNTELVAVNTQQRQLQELVTAIIPDDFEHQLNQLSGLGTTVNGLQSDMTRIHQALQGLSAESKRSEKTRPVIVDTTDHNATSIKTVRNTPAATVPVVAEQDLVARRIVSGVVADNWIVNLASLSTQQQAQQALNKLQRAGVAPLIQETVVKGKRVYRLSVDGFATRDAALKFIAHAKSSLGFDGGWARRG